MKNKSIDFISLFFCLVFVNLLWLNFSGCSFIRKDAYDPAQQKPLQPQPMFRFSDLPIPAGFKVLPEQSYSFEAAGMRVGILKYKGSAHPAQVVAFYKENMPNHNWELLNAVEYGERLLNFSREKETCIVTITPKGSGSLITISFGPKGQNPPKTQKPLK